MSKDQKEPSKASLMASILEKFEIKALNPMQREAGEAIRSKSDVVLLSPTGTGKTLAFLLPLIQMLKPDIEGIQLLILAPSRELAQQIEQVTRKMGSGFKANAVYGGRAGALDKDDLKQLPTILIGTPGRIADRFRRDQFALDGIHTLVLDEFDKSLEMGFEKEMKEIVRALLQVKQRVLTSATSEAKIPSFLGLEDPIAINYLKEYRSQLTLKTIVSPDKDKLKTLAKALNSLSGKPGIVFCNFKDSIERVSDYLTEQNIAHNCFHGGMEQMEREQVLVKFRNGSNQLLLATDLAARGLDIPEIEFILHYHLPLRDKEFTHRNGRTARMNRDGVAYILHWEEESLPDFIQEHNPENHTIQGSKEHKSKAANQWKTIYITGGRRDKISKGDVAGFLLKQGQLEANQIGLIEVKQNYTYVGVEASIAEKLIAKTNNTKLKKKKVRISLV